MYVTYADLIQIGMFIVALVNSMDVSYIPIAKARGFTIHLDKNLYFSQSLL